MMTVVYGFVGFIALMVLLVQLFRFAINRSSKKLLAEGVKHDTLHKKFYDVDINRYGSLFMNIGLIITLAICLAAFEWKTYDEVAVMDLGSLEAVEEQQEEIPQTVQTQPPPPKIQQPEIIEVPDEEEIENKVDVDLNVEVDQETVVEQVVQQQKTEAVVEEIEEVFEVVEEGATPSGGYPAFYEYIRKNLKYPAQARRMGVEGKVYVQFVVDKDGSLTEVKAIKGIGAGCDEEAMRVVKEAAKWKPGKQRGRSVKQRIVMPIAFKLG